MDRQQWVKSICGKERLLMADHLQKKAIRVSGHLEEKRGIYQMVLSWTDREGKRQRQNKSTGLQTRGDKKRA